MNIKPSQAKLKQLLLSVLCASAVNFSAFAEYMEVTGGDTLMQTGKTYDADEDHPALYVSDPNSLYSGTDISLSSTFNNRYGAYVQNQGALSLTGGTITTTIFDYDFTAAPAHGVVIDSYASGTLNNVNIATSSDDWGDVSHGVFVQNFSTLTLTGGTISGDGNGIRLTGSSSATVTDAYFEIANYDYSYDGVFVQNSSTLTLLGGTISGNGGGIQLTGSSSATVTDVHIALEGGPGPGCGVTAQDSSTLALTNCTISVANDYDVVGIYLTGSSSATVNDTYIESGRGNEGVYANSSTLALTGGTIHSNNGYGIYLTGSSSATVINAYIETMNDDGWGSNVSVANSSTLALTGGTIHSYAGSGIQLTGNSSATVTDAHIETITGWHDEVNANSSVLVQNSSTLTLTGGTITANYDYYTSGDNLYGIQLIGSSNATVTGADIITNGAEGRCTAYALAVEGHSSGTVNLNNNTLSSSDVVIRVSGTSTLTLSGSNGSVITGDVISGTNSSVDLTLSGEGSKFVGNVTQDATSAVTLTLGGGATLGDAALATAINGQVTIKDGGHLVTTVILGNGVTLEAGTILDYVADNTLQITGGTVSVGESILIDFGGVTVGDGAEFTVLDWSTATGSVSADAFTATNLGSDMTGSFTVDGTQLIFTAGAIPEPSTYFLLGAGLGLLLLTARYRRQAGTDA
jgi:parallel beta-helix repeat protein